MQTSQSMCAACPQNLETKLEDLLRDKNKPPAQLAPRGKPVMTGTSKQRTSNMISVDNYHIMGPNCYTMTQAGYKYKGKH